MSLKSINPTNEELIQEYAETSAEVVDVRLQMAAEAFSVWKDVSFADRAERLRSLAGILREDIDRLARLMTEEMGKPIGQARAEIEKCGWVCEYYAEHGQAFLEPRSEPTDAARSYVRYDPLGPILAIMPWNFPFWQVFRCAAPSVMAGNVVILKHASNVSGVALEIEKLFVRTEFPAGVFTTLLVNSEQTDELIAHPSIRAVTLTGSERAGRAVGAAAGQHLKPSVLELGGSDPFIILGDANPDQVAASAAQARCQNNGQSCIAAKRFIVEQRIAERFLTAMVREMSSLKVGDPLNEENDMGPLAREDLRQTLHEQVEQSLEQGAEAVCGGSVPQGTGYFYPPTVLTRVGPGMAAFDDETFGPVAAVTVAKDRDEAIELANRSSFGLGASLWTSDIDEGERLAARIAAGCVSINDIVKSNPHLPFGGVKQSGYGRELSREGIRAFMNTKSVWVG